MGAVDLSERGYVCLQRDDGGLPSAQTWSQKPSHIFTKTVTYVHKNCHIYSPKPSHMFTKIIAYIHKNRLIYSDHLQIIIDPTIKSYSKRHKGPPIIYSNHIQLGTAPPPPPLDSTQWQTGSQSTSPQSHPDRYLR